MAQHAMSMDAPFVVYEQRLSALAKRSKRVSHDKTGPTYNLLVMTVRWTRMKRKPALATKCTSTPVQGSLGLDQRNPYNIRSKVYSVTMCFSTFPHYSGLNLM